MILIHVLIPAGYPQVHCIRGVGVIYKFIKRSVFPQVDLGINLRASIFGASYEADVL